VAKSKVKKPVVKKSPVKKTPAKKTAPKKVVPKKTATKKAAPKKANPKKAVAKKAIAKKTVVKKTAAKKVTLAKPFASAKVQKADFSGFVTPLDDRVMVKLAEAERMTAGGLYIPDTVADVSGNLQGIVVSVGRGHRNDKGHVRPMDLKVGDKVLFSEYAGTKLKLQDQDVLILRESDVLGVVS
jgi:chaperonin GroES